MVMGRGGGGGDKEVDGGDDEQQEEEHEGEVFVFRFRAQTLSETQQSSLLRLGSWRFHAASAHLRGLGITSTADAVLERHVGGLTKTR